MKYVRNNLGKDECIIFETRAHGFYTNLYGMLSFILGNILVYYALNPIRMVMFMNAVNPDYYIGMLFGVLLLFFFFYKTIILFSTEVSLTNKRLVFKTGIVARNIFEISLDKIESVNISQGILERILGAGKIILSGVGSQQKTIESLGRVIQLKDSIPIQKN